MLIIIFNVFVLGCVLLIGYWWANQGLFSAILHLLCVVAAGAIALAFWEPLTVGVLLRGGRFDCYAWGISLVMLFAVSLLVLRLAADKIAPANVELPHWANLTFGFPLGLAAGVLTMGIFLIGSGFIQSRTEIMGYTGWTRSAQRGVVDAPEKPMWLPIHAWTVHFYEFLSVGSLRTRQPLAQYNPDLDRQSMSLIRDSFSKGRGQVALAPTGAQVESVTVDQQSGRYAIQVRFDARARDFGEQLTLSQSQVRVICSPRSTRGQATVVHPDRWIQGGVEYRFDSMAHYATTTPGQEAGGIIFLVSVPAGEVPAYIQIKGTRFRLPPAQPGTIAAGSTSTTSAGTLPPPSTAIGGSIDSALRVSNDIRPVTASKNTIPSGISQSDGYLTEGEGQFPKGGLRPSRSLRIEGIFEPAGTRVVKLDVSVGGPADIFGDVRRQAGPDARLMLVDNLGRTYSPMGYIHEQPNIGTTIRLEPRNFVAKLEDLPVLPTSGIERLQLLFTVTTGATVTSFRFGDVTVGTCNLPIEAPKK